MIYSLFIAYGASIPDEKEKADLWLLNSCTVKNPAEDHFRNEINKARETNKYIVVAGCVPQGQQKTDYLQVNEMCYQTLSSVWNIAFGVV